jgi:hypothetical protein
MKNSIWHLSVLLLAVFAVSCTPENFWEEGETAAGFLETIEASDLPTSVQTQLEDNYAEETIVSVARITGSDDSELYGIGFESGENITLRGDGEGCPSIELEDLPTAITDYVGTNYPDELIVHAVSMERDGVLRYHVRVSSGEVLSFDSSGEFLEMREGRERRRRHHHRRCGTDIRPADLPAAAQTYLSDNFAASTVEKAVSIERRDGSTVYLVKLDTGERMAFDEAGELLELPTGWAN